MKWKETGHSSEALALTKSSASPNSMDTFSLPFELTNGNTGRGHQWFRSAKLRKQFEAGIRAMGLARKPYDVPCNVTVTRVLGKGQRLWDSSSIGRGNYKELEDALVACGWFVDDSPKHITRTLFRQDESRREEGPFTEIQVTPSGQASLIKEGV